MSYPAPILNLDFVNAKQLAHPTVAFSRASIGSYFDSSGILRYARSGVPRFDHDPLTGVCKGLLVESSATNLDTYSDEFDNAVWTKSLCSVAADSSTAPDGTTSMDKIVESTDNGFHAVSRTFTIATGNGVVYSVFARKGETSVLQINFNSGADVIYARFDLAAGTILVDATCDGSGAIFSNYKAYIKDCRNGRYRCIIYAQTKDTTSITVYNALYNGSSMYTGDGTSGLYLWGANLQKWVVYPSSYCKSTTSAVVRAADVCSVDLTKLVGPGGEALWDGTEGTIVVDFTVGLQVSNVRAISLHSGTTSNCIDIGAPANGQLVSRSTVSGTAESYLFHGVPIANTRYKIAFAFAVNSQASSCNGGAVVTDASCGVPSVTTLEIGSLISALQLNGTIRSLQLYNRRIADAYLPALSAL